MTGHCLVLRLAGPLQSWGVSSRFNRRDTQSQPTKSGVLGLLAAAEGRRRQDSIEDLLGLSLLVRVDQPGSRLRDYHTVSTLDGEPLLSANVSPRGRQMPTSPKKLTHVTQRFYLQDAVFVAVVEGPLHLLGGLESAIQRPVFPLALGRRACVPTQPLLLRDEDGGEIWTGGLIEVARRVPWQAAAWHRRRVATEETIRLPISLDDADGQDVATDVPSNFEPTKRGMMSRRVSHAWVEVPTDVATTGASHDPFSLL
ncbi:type I-E CRISPR-associated protein Cas5/CasD [Tessaracoccus sp. Z1128]